MIDEDDEPLCNENEERETATLYLQVEFIKDKSDGESISYALDSILDTALTSIPLQEYGDATVGKFFPIDPDDLKEAIEGLQALANFAEAQPALNLLKKLQ